MEVVERLQAMLEVGNLAGFSAGMEAADRATGGTKDQLRALAEISKVATEALKNVKMTAAQAAESTASASTILEGVKGISDEARVAAHELDRVKLTQAQATETALVAEEQSRSLKKVEDQAVKTRIAMSGGGMGRGSIIGGTSTNILAGAIGAGALLAPSAGPGVLGLLAAIPAAATAGAGALGTLALAFDGVGKAIGGNLKAFKALQPAQQEFVLTVRSLTGFMDRLKQTAGQSLFPGLTAGLKDALSPGTVGAITRAVTEFGTAIGHAGEQWGRYFGSAQFQRLFGPMMQTGARALSTLSDAALHLFDTLGVLGRAAGPLVDWMMHGIDAASRWADSFTKAQDASGGLAHAMNEAQTSLRLVGDLLGALLKVVYDLGAALYPVSQVAVKALTDGLNALADIIRRNQDAIRSVVGTFVSDFIAVIKTAATVVGFLVDQLARVVGAKAQVIAAAVAIGAAMALVFGPESVLVAGAIVAVGEIIRHWSAIKDFFKTLAQEIINAFDWVWVELQREALKAALAVVEPFSHLPSFLGGWARKAKDSMQDELDKLVPPPMDWSSAATMAGVSTGKAWMAGFMSQASAAAAGVPADTAAKAAAGAARSRAGVAGKMSSKDVLALLMNAGFSATDAQNFVGIANAESGLRYNALNNNASTGDYSVGLFQENFFKNLGPARTKRYAPMFGLSPNMDPTRFVAWLQDHPAAQATIAHDLFNSAGYSPWAGDAYIKSHPELLNQTAPNDTSVFGDQPPWTSGLPHKKHKPKPPAIPQSIVTLLNRASANASKSKQLGNLGGTARSYLEDELSELKTADEALQKLHPKSANDKITVSKKITEVENKMRDVQTLIKKSALEIGDALLPDGFKEKMKALTAKFKADSTLASSLTGQAAIDYTDTIRKGLLEQAALLQTQVTRLKARLGSSSGRQKTEIQKELDKLTTQLDQVRQSVLSTLQSAVSAVQGRVGTAFSTVQQQLVAAFEANTQKMVDQLGAQFSQNGLLTPNEQKLASMQAQDQLQGYLDSLQEAKDQLAKDQNTLLKQVYEATTGVTTNVYDPAAQAQITADNKALAAAQRAYDEYQVSITASQERAQADSDYAAALKRLTDDRTRQEQELTDKLSKLADQFQNGTGSFAMLQSIAKQYGVDLSDVAMPAQADLASATSDLTVAFQDLAAYIGKITGTTPKVPTAPGASGAGTGPGSAAWNAGVAAAIAAPHDDSDVISRLLGRLPSHADGGPTKQGPAMLHDDEYVVPKGGALVRGGGATTLHVELNVNTLDPRLVDWNSVAAEAVDAIHAELLKKKNRNGGRLNLN